MNTLQRQQEILNELSNLIHNETDQGYQSATCEYTFHVNFNTTSSKFSFIINGNTVKKALSDETTMRNRDIAEELRTLMKEHTGGEWTSFTLTLDANGKATTKFVYPES